MFSLGRLTFSSSRDFLERFDFQITHEVREFINIVTEAHRCGANGIMHEFYIAGDLAGYGNYAENHNAQVMEIVRKTGKIPEDNWFASIWELTQAYYPPEGSRPLPSNTFMFIVTYGTGITKYEFTGLDDAEYERYRKELWKRENR